MAQTASLEDIEDQTSPGVASLSDIDDTPPEVTRALATVPLPRPDYMQTERPLTGWLRGQAEPTPVSPEAVEEQKNLDDYRQRRAQDKNSISAKDVAGAMVQAFTNPAAGAEPTPGSEGLGQETKQSLTELGTPGQRGKGALRLAGTGLEALTPAVGPAAIESPINVARGFGEGYLAGKGVRKIAKTAGASPETQDLAEQAGQLAPIVGESLLRPKLGIASSPEGTAVTGTVRGAGAGVAVTPEGVTLRGKVGPLEASKTFTRTPKPVEPALTPRIIEGELAKNPPTRDEIADAQAATNYAGPEQAKAAVVLQRIAEGRASVATPDADNGTATPIETRSAVPPPTASTVAETRLSEPSLAPEPTALRVEHPAELPSVNGRAQTAHISEIQQPARTAHIAEIEPKISNDSASLSEVEFKHRSTQVNIPEGSEAHQALETTRARISDSDLAAKGKDVGGNHVTVRWGLQAADDDKLEKIKSYLSTVAPFEAKLGKTEKFEPSESSDGAAVIQSPVEAPEMKQIHDELAKHGDFTEPTFTDYKPHATIAYVKPEKADRYVGMSPTAGKKFTVNSIAVTDRNGNQKEVKLGGKSEVKPAAVLPQRSDEQVAAPAKTEKVGETTPAVVEAGRDKIIESELKHLKQQRAEVVAQMVATSPYGEKAMELRKTHDDFLRKIQEREDELSRLKGEPTRAEKRDLQTKEVEKPFAERPKEALSYDDPKHSQHWQALEPDYIEKRFADKVKTHERAIIESQQELKDSKPGTKKRSDALMNLEYRKKALENFKAKDPRSAQSFKTEYTELVRKAVSQGKPVPQAVIDQRSEFKLAQDARERYEKGRHTSFANKSAAINDTMQKKEGFKVKRQDGKAITDDQIKEISSGVDDVVKVLGAPLRDAMRGTDLTIAHTSGKHPFLSDAGGMYHSIDRTISAGIEDLFGRPVKALAHEMGHWFDFESGKAIGVKNRIYTKSGKSHVTQYLSESDASKQMYDLAKRTMTDTREVSRMLKLVKLSDLPENERAEVERVKVVLGPYWREPRELFARMFEQYVADELGKSSTAAEDINRYFKTPGWWSKEAWAKLKPMMAEEIGKRFDALKERHAPAEVAAPASAVSQPPETSADKSNPEFGQAKRELYPNKKELTDAEVGKVIDRAAEIAKEKKSQLRREVISTAKSEYSVQKQLKGTNGSGTTLLTSGGERPAKYRVVEAADLVPSHNSQTFARNTTYPEGVQERAYDTSKEAQNRVIQQTEKFNPDYVINTNPDAVNGPPIITPDGIVLGGNSRAMTIQRLYKAGRFMIYKQMLAKQADTFGLNKDVVRMMKEPVLVREVEAPKTLDEMRALGSELNKSMTGALGVNERAVSAGKAVSRETLNSIAGMIDSLGDSASLRDAMRERGADIVKLLLKDGAITERERPQFVDTANGGLSEEGKTFVERALLGSVVDDPRLMDAAPKSVLNKLDSSLAALSSLAPRTDAYNILPLIRDALREHAEIASKGITLEDHLNQSSLFGVNRNPAVDAIVRTLGEKPTAVKIKLRQFAQDANFDVQGQGMLAIGNQPSPADAFNAAFDVDVTQKELENAIIQSAQSDTGVERDRAAGNTQEGAGNLQQPAAGEARASSQGTTEAGRSEEKTKLIDLLKSESGAFNASKLSPRHLKRGYNRFIDKHMDKTLDMGDKYRRVAEHDPDIALMLKEKDNAPRYVRDKAESNIEQVTKGLTPDQVRYASMLSDSNAREHLEENHPDQFDEAQNDPAVMAAVQSFKQLQDELAQLRIGLGWHVRRDLSVFENEPNAKGRIAWSVLDRDGNEVESFKSHQDAQDYVEENGKILDHLKRVYPEHLREPLMGRTDEAASLGAPKGGIRPPRPDRKRRRASADYFYEHGAKDFSGYIKSFTQAYHAALNQKIYDSLTDEATRWKEGTALPPQIEYRGKTYYSPDVAKSMKLASPANRPKRILEYRAYDPAKDDKALIKDFENGWSTTTTGRPGISPSDRYLAPKEVVDALEHYDTTRGLQENDRLRRFFQDQIVGLFGPNIHVLNIMRRLAQTVGTGAWDPRVWPYYEKLFFSKELRERMASGLADDAIDALSKWGSYTNARDIGSLHDYVLGNMDPRNWARWTIGKFSKGILFDPKFMGGFGGLDQKARVLTYDFLRNHEGMDEEEATKNVDDGYGRYNKANWTERMRRWGRALLFPGWDFSSLLWFLRHPFKTAVAPALVTLGVNLAIHAAGKNKDQDKYDYGYIHYGDRKYRSSLVTEAMALHIATPLLEAGKAALEGGDKREIASAAAKGVVRGGAGLAGVLRPEIQGGAEFLANRQYIGGEKEIWKPEDANIPGRFSPTRQYDKMITFTLVKALPALNRFLDSSYSDVDLGTGLGSIVGVTNYRYGAEERLKANVAKSMGYKETLSTLAERDPQAAKQFVSDRTKAAYLMFHGDLSKMEKDLTRIDKKREEVNFASGLSDADRKHALTVLNTARARVLSAADTLNDRLTDVKLAQSPRTSERFETVAGIR